MFEPKATASHLDSTRFGHGAMSDLSPLSGVERTTSAQSEYFAF